MIYYICHRRHGYAIGIFLTYFDNSFNDRLRIIAYEDLFRLTGVQTGTFIFTDFDRIDADQRKQTHDFVTYLRTHAPDAVIMNDPTKSLERFDLLSALHADDPASPAVAHLAQWEGITEFPVFIRGANDHLPALSDLIETKQELEQKAKALLAQYGPNEDIIIITFKNQRNANGDYEKYGAYRVGDVIYAQHLYQNRHWWVKDVGSEWTEARKIADHAYRRDNPHAAALMPVFQKAAIEYGRIDYCVLDGKIVVFEINTNPVVNANPKVKGGRFRPELNAEKHNDALNRLDSITGPHIDLASRVQPGIIMLTVDSAHRRMINRTKRKIFGRRVRAWLSNRDPRRRVATQ